MIWSPENVTCAFRVKLEIDAVPDNSTDAVSLNTAVSIASGATFAVSPPTVQLPGVDQLALTAPVQVKDNGSRVALTV